MDKNGIQKSLLCPLSSNTKNEELWNKDVFEKPPDKTDLYL